MRVRCLSESVEPIPALPGRVPFLTVGNVYSVIAILVSVQPSGSTGPLLQLIDDGSDPSWHESKLFETVSTRVPSNWACKLLDTGGIHVAPSPWLETGFWDRWYDERYNQRLRGPATVAYEESLETILRES
jgi:hypothetical protein